MSKAYINGIGCVSAQDTSATVFGDGLRVNDQNNVLPIVAPAYKEFISGTAIRRMSGGVKNSIVASALAMKEAGVEMPDAIITGTGLGCIEDSNKFLGAIINNNEEFLTPTSFIQSTHNTVAAQIALGLQCKAYNFTYVNAAVSFESALLDGKMKLEEGAAHTVLTGGTDEMSGTTAIHFKIAGFIKKDDQQPYAVLGSETTGAVYSEGATFFVVEDEIKTSTYAEVTDIAIRYKIAIDEIAAEATDFLSANGMQPADIDAVVLGYNGDVEFDTYYNELAKGIFAGIPQVYYKHLSGEYNTSSAFGLWAGANIIKAQQIPDIMSVNQHSRSSYRNMLLYNQYNGTDHSFILLSSCRATS